MIDVQTLNDALLTLAFCVGLAASNVLAALKAALRAVHGPEAVEEWRFTG